MKTAKNKLNGQILVVLLIALSILSIFVVVVASNTRRDVIQTVQNEEYEQALSVSENKLIQIIEGDIDPDTDSDCNTSSGTIECEFTTTPEDGSGLELITKVEYNDSVQFNNLGVEKDRSFKVLLANYVDHINFTWTGDVAWQLTVDYQDKATGEYKVYKEVYDGGVGILTNPGSSTKCIADTLVGFDPKSSMSVTISDIETCIPGNLNDYDFLSLRMRALMGGTSGSTELSLIGYKFSGVTNQPLPKQATVIISDTTSRTTGDDFPRAVVESVIPLHATPFEIFDYVLRTESDINK